MKNKQIGNLERMVIAECVKDVPSFGKISRLFEMGADPNAVNEYGECVLGIVFEGYCSMYGTKLRSGFFAPHIVAVFLQYGFDAKRHGLKVISELQNSCYDRYIRMAIKTILSERNRMIKRDIAIFKNCMKNISDKVYRFLKAA